MTTTVTPFRVLREALLAAGVAGRHGDYESTVTCPVCTTPLRVTSDWDTGGSILECAGFCSGREIETAIALHGERVIVTNSVPFAALARREGQAVWLVARPNQYPPVMLRGCRISLVWNDDNSQGVLAPDMRAWVSQVAMAVEVVS